MEHSPTHKYLFPRHYRERIYDGVGRTFECAVAHSQDKQGQAVFGGIRPMYTKQLSGDGTMFVVDTPFGPAIDFDDTGGALRLEYDKSGNYTGNQALGDVSGSFTLILRVLVRSTTSQVIFTHGSTATTTGYYARRYDNATSDYAALYGYGGSSGSFFYSTPLNLWDEGVWYSYIFVVEEGLSSLHIYQDAKELGTTDLGFEQPANAINNAGPRFVFGDYMVARVSVFDKALSPAEVAMVSADLM